MNCPNCKRTVPSDAKFCIYCATRIAPEPAPGHSTPATGPTTRLDPRIVPAYTMPSAPPAKKQSSQAPRKHARRQAHSSMWPWWMIGIGMLLLTNSFFPGILVLLGVSKYVKETRRGRYARANQRLVFFLGLAAIFWFGMSWPLLLLWLGLLMLLNQRQNCVHC